MNAMTAERQTSQSSVRLLQIMECMAVNRTPMRLQDISRAVGMTQPTVLRYLYTLEDAGYIYQDEESSRYGLTWRICSLSDGLNSMLGLRNITTPFTNRLANSLSLGVCLVIDRNNECMYLDCIDNPSSPTLQRIGKQAPLHATGSGKILLSQYSDSQFEDYFSSGLAKYTEYTITDADALRTELSAIRLQGYAMDNEECEVGLRCVSCPLRDYTSRIIAAMSVFGKTSDMSEAVVQETVLPLLKQITQTISTRLGYVLAPNG